MTWGKDYFAEYERRRARDLARAEEEAEKTGKERFDLGRLESALNRGSQAANEPLHRAHYYLVHPEVRTLAEYARIISGVDPHLLPASSTTPAATTAPVKRARTVEEICFAAALERCRECRQGQRLVPTDVRPGNARSWICRATCPGCGNSRTLELGTLNDPTRTRIGRYDLGPLRSEVIRAEDFLDVLSELDARLDEDPEARRVALVCVTELMKLLALDAEELPGSTDPRTKRSWLRAETLRLKGLVNRSAPPPTLDDEMLARHRAWLDAGAKGAGQIVLRRQRFANQLYPPVDCTFAEIAESDLTGIDLAEARFQFALLEDNVFTFADLRATLFANATIRRGTWRSINGSSARFDEATIEGTDFGRSDLEGSSWCRASVANARFDGARFGSAALDAASFRDCSFVNASFARSSGEPTSEGARFVDCDLTDTDWKDRHLRGTTFRRCKLAGAYGVPASTDGLVLEDCDVDPVRLGWSGRRAST